MQNYQFGPSVYFSFYIVFKILGYCRVQVSRITLTTNLIEATNLLKVSVFFDSNSLLILGEF